MDLENRLSAHLQALSLVADADFDDQMVEIAAGLALLARDLAFEVPSCLSVSIVLSRPNSEITISRPAATLVGDDAQVVLASLGVPLTTATGGAVLLLQAAHAGAFVLLADDLVGQRDPQAPPLLVDQHLVLRADPDGGGLSAELADLRVLEQAVGALIDQGWLPAQARHELDDRARTAQLSAPRIARQLLAALPGQGHPHRSVGPP